MDPMEHLFGHMDPAKRDKFIHTYPWVAAFLRGEEKAHLFMRNLMAFEEELVGDGYFTREEFDHLIKQLHKL